MHFLMRLVMNNYFRDQKYIQYIQLIHIGKPKILYKKQRLNIYD